MRLSLDDWIPSLIFLTGGYDVEDVCVDYFLRAIDRAACVLDIGANIGYYTIQAAQRLKATGGVVHAFEPVGRTFSRLEENIALNGLDNVRANRNVVFDETSREVGRLPIFVADDRNTGSSSLAPVDSFHSGTTEVVPCVSIDDYLAEHAVARVDVCKIDVEGAELHVLRGMQGVLDSASPAIFVEINSSMLAAQGTGAAEVVDFLARFGYQPWRITPQGLASVESISDESLMYFAKTTREAAGARR